MSRFTTTADVREWVDEMRSLGWSGDPIDAVECAMRLVDAAVAAERERCAAMVVRVRRAQTIDVKLNVRLLDECAAAIREGAKESP